MFDRARLMTPHRFHPDGCEWALTTLGICVDGGLPERTRGEPTTMRRLWGSLGQRIAYYAGAFHVPCELILATIATESGGEPSAVRLEPGYVSDDETPHRVSLGLMQTLISTARAAMNNKAVSRSFLLTPAGSIEAGTAYIAMQEGSTHFDPPLVAAAYNAGGVYHQDGQANRFKLRCYPIGSSEHIDRWIQWFNDCFRMWHADGSAPECSFYRMLA